MTARIVPGESIRTSVAKLKNLSGYLTTFISWILGLRVTPLISRSASRGGHEGCTLKVGGPKRCGEKSDSTTVEAGKAWKEVGRIKGQKVPAIA